MKKGRVKRTHTLGAIFTIIFAIILLSNLLPSSFWAEWAPRFPFTTPHMPLRVTSARHCSMRIVPPPQSSPPYSYRVGDLLTVSIVVRDYNGSAKLRGGDYFRARIHSAAEGYGRGGGLAGFAGLAGLASLAGFGGEGDGGGVTSAAGAVRDHGNGTYSATFRLLWPGATAVSISLVHSREAVALLARLRDEAPDKVFFYGYFEGGGRTERTECNAVKPGRVHGGAARADEEQEVCEFRDAGERWFCVRPPTLPCSAWSYHSMGGYRTVTTRAEDALLHRSVTDVPIGGGDLTITVQPSKRHACPHAARGCPPPRRRWCRADSTWRESGTPWCAPLGASARRAPWHAASGAAESSCTGTPRCASGGSCSPTPRPVSEPRALKVEANNAPLQLGPLIARDPEAGAVVLCRSHGLPLRSKRGPVSSIHYIANELDSLPGLPGTVVVLSVCAHFTSFPAALYAGRVDRIGAALRRLLRRAPHTLVLVKSANTGYRSAHGSEWLARGLDALMRRALRRHLGAALGATGGAGAGGGGGAVVIDAWDMSAGHPSPDDIHPVRAVVRAEVELFLSYVCPDEV
uniref:NXPE family member 3-like isoform X1 n=1 Tax=Petromyzon marinus TaxID=7757 RepID=A0AAJ7WXT5_PETMA|nr:NXPE family member 3-like isoform X1 [Petromyzon marinus]XP_032814023.1 NXPE family member 3-like isoform X1 [Petromyzon marinus]XP_032814024.1 NXPE family member 3-like isoform X2 [Petromyzon marinus]XP_032814025.1 NXPE family member 3-like isoform X1 [Petromyzon marinus]XP_032814026.1 NXPE family member 3-like isoform X1 [Petromyzon marinus]XP_032814027.1 NXPE family member 3-like isoform X3 [Petromyzon marinus]XP_032814028.1 NXPE family member 3-like isoform X1 [Petromyzon marinus]XP_0